ncbi:MAG: hypothetical protein HY821_15965 [Acidobacteria bacterium]|nr:hypothetical protein [Acidobacteriota bacterium]
MTSALLIAAFVFAGAQPSDVLLDALVWGADVVKINPANYPAPIRKELTAYLQRFSALQPAPAQPMSREFRMVAEARYRYGRRLAAVSASPQAPALASAYVEALQPCYEWEGLPDCPQREALFALNYRQSHPNSPFHDYLLLLEAHRWLCAAEAFSSAGQAGAAQTARQSSQAAAAAAQESKSHLLRTAAARLNERSACLPPR